MRLIISIHFLGFLDFTFFTTRRTASSESNGGTIVSSKLRSVFTETTPRCLVFSDMQSFLSVSGTQAGSDDVATATEGIATLWAKSAAAALRAWENRYLAPGICAAVGETLHSKSGSTVP
jgi:hypothetical protein